MPDRFDIRDIDQYPKSRGDQDDNGEDAKQRIVDDDADVAIKENQPGRQGGYDVINQEGIKYRKDAGRGMAKFDISTSDISTLELSR